MKDIVYLDLEDWVESDGLWKRTMDGIYTFLEWLFGPSATPSVTPSRYSQFSLCKYEFILDLSIDFRPFYCQETS